MYTIDVSSMSLEFIILIHNLLLYPMLSKIESALGNKHDMFDDDTIL